MCSAEKLPAELFFLGFAPLIRLLHFHFSLAGFGSGLPKGEEGTGVFVDNGLGKRSFAKLFVSRKKKQDEMSLLVCSRNCPTKFCTRGDIC